MENNEDIVEITGENGETYKAEVIDLITFENAEYAVLSPIEEHHCEDENCDCADDYVLMRVKKEGEEYYFETIDDDDEFERVSEYIENIADEIED